MKKYEDFLLGVAAGLLLCALRDLGILAVSGLCGRRRGRHERRKEGSGR